MYNLHNYICAGPVKYCNGLACGCMPRPIYMQAVPPLVVAAVRVVLIVYVNCKCVGGNYVLICAEYVGCNLA